MWVPKPLKLARKLVEHRAAVLAHQRAPRRELGVIGLEQLRCGRDKRQVLRAPCLGERR